MENSRFSTLIYRIIGKPDRWHDDYIDVMNKIIDETDSFDDPANFSELEVGDQILSRIRGTNNALDAFSTLLNESRFKMIILDDKLAPIYHNQNAGTLVEEVLEANANNGEQQLKPSLSILVKKVIEDTQQNQQNHLIALKALDKDGAQIYLRSINQLGISGNQSTLSDTKSKFHLLLVLDQHKQKNLLNTEFVTQYNLTEKEQNVLLKLIHGSNVKQTANALFVSENTIKSHLKSLFRKTKSKSQADVIRLALTHESQILDSYFDPDTGITATSSPESQDLFKTLKCGLRVAYREYGPKDGDPIVVSHNGWGSRVMVPDSFLKILEQFNKRLIIPDRPGTGLTPFKQGHPESWTAKFSEFVCLLDLDHYELLGAVNGAVFALLYALEQDPKLKKIRLASPIFVNSRKDMDFLTGIYAPSARLVRASKRFAREIYQLWLKSINMNASKHYRSMVEQSLTEKENTLFNEKGIRYEIINSIVSSFHEGASRNLEGISNDMVFCISPRKVDLSRITTPVEIWWGTEDPRFSQAGVEKLASQINTSNLHIMEGYSEHTFFSLFEEILR